MLGPWSQEKPFLIVTEMVRSLASPVYVRVMVPTEEVKIQVQNRLRELKVDERQIGYWTASSSLRRWYRDTEAIFLKTYSGDLKAVDFDFNCYGECRTGSEEARQKKVLTEIAALADV